MKTRHVDIRAVLLRAGVRNLREFGYTDCDESNILRDQIYSALFDCMLASHSGHAEIVQAIRSEISNRLTK